MYEKLKSLLNEWKKYSNPNEKMPENIRENEKWSIGKSVELTLTEMRGTGEYSEITEDDKELIEKIYNFLVTVASIKG